MKEISKINKYISAVLIALAGVVLAYSLYQLPFNKFDLPLLGMAIGTIFLGSYLHIQLPRTQIFLSFPEAVIFFVLLTYGIEIAVVLAAVEAVYVSFYMRRKGADLRNRTILHNASSGIISTFAAGWLAFSAYPFSMNGGNFQDITVLASVLGIIAGTYFVFNSFIVALVTSFKPDKTFWKTVYDNCLNTFIMQIVGATVAGLLVKTLENIDPVLIGVTLFVGIVGYITYRRNTADVKETAARAEQAERERAEQAEKHIEELQHHIIEQDRISHELRVSKENFRHAAFHDGLTDLPNRNLFLETLKFLLEKSKHDSKYQFAILFLDLDRFKTINESLGHSVGDKLILHVAKRLSNLVKEGDLVARFSGDEFAVILNKVKDKEEVVNFADQIKQKISDPFTLGGRQVFTDVSIGIAMANPRYKDAEDILRDADIAMYYSKEQNKDYVIFDQMMHTRAVTLLQIETDLRYAVDRGELCTFYQPVIDNETLDLVGFEALIRWNHPKRGLVPPGEFISVSEQTGLIIPITLWILRDSCSQLVEWQKLSPANKDLFVSVNLSGKHFAHNNLVEQIEKIIVETKINPAYLKLEITESAVMENAERVISMLEQLKGLGIKLSIDDFGTGYSSLSYLHRFPIDTLKVDRSFVSTMESGSENGEIVRTIVSLAKSLNLDVIAEGIETIHQLHQLRILGCEYGQGYLFSRPVPVNEAEEIIADKKRWQNVIPSQKPIPPNQQHFGLSTKNSNELLDI